MCARRFLPKLKNRCEHFKITEIIVKYLNNLGLLTKSSCLSQHVREGIHVLIFTSLPKVGPHFSSATVNIYIIYFFSPLWKVQCEKVLKRPVKKAWENIWEIFTSFYSVELCQLEMILLLFYHVDIVVKFFPLFSVKLPRNLLF